MKFDSVIQLADQVAQQGVGAVAEADRQTILSAARTLVSAFEPPVEKVARLTFYDSTLFTAVRIGLGLDLYRKLFENDAPPTTVADIARTSKGDGALIGRILKHVSTAGFVTETGPDTYQANEVTKVLASDEGAGMVINCYDGIKKVEARLPEFFEHTNYKNPTDKDDKDASPWKWCTGIDKPYFQWLFAPGNEFQANAFNNHMRLKTMGPRWYDFVPVDEMLGGVGSVEGGGGSSSNTDGGPPAPSDVLLVDIGGSTGEDLLGFHHAHPKLSGRLVVQDLPGAFDTVAPEHIHPVEPMAHDFFTTQPLRGARAYFLKMVLHDWPDVQCREILANIKPALAPGYSRILINEIVVPATRADWFSTGVDMLMLMAHASQERTEQHWHELVGSVGLKITKIWAMPGVPEKLIEVELA